MSGIGHWRARIAGGLLALLMALPLRAAETPRLTLYLWRDYLSPELIQRFEQRESVQIELIHFDDADEREEMLASNNASGFDLVCISENHLTQPGLQHWMLPLDRRRLPNLRHVHYPLNGVIHEAPAYAVPYFWGTLGIAYRRDRLPAAPTSWRDLYEQSPAHSGQVLMYPTLRLLLGTALLAEGADFNSTDPAAIQRAGARLLAQVPHVRAYRGVDLSENSLLVKGQVVVQQLYNGDALFLQQFQPEIAFAYPREGANLWVDYFVIPRNAAHKTLAYRFLDYLNEPAVALENALFLNYATPNDTARALAPESYRNNPLIFPPDAVVQAAHIIQPLDSQTLRLYTDIALQATTRYEMLQPAE